MSTGSFEHRQGGVRDAIVVKASVRAKVMRLRVDPRTGTVVLTVPRRVSQRRALEWASRQREWIEAALDRLPPQVRLVPGGWLPFRGDVHRIDWNPAHPRTPRAEEGSIRMGGPEELVEARLLRWLRDEARRLLAQETLEFAAVAGVSVTRVGVGDPASRWGSCSSSGAIRYSWRLIMAPDYVRRATVAHEVAHLIHMNHGADFHALVRTLFGADPAPARTWLRREGFALHRIGLVR